MRPSYVVTDRHGLRAGALGRVALPGRSRGPWAGLDLATHVDDDPGHVAANRSTLAAAVGVAPDRLVTMDQVHGADVVLVDAPPAEPPAADALVTLVPGLAVVAQVADCVPVVLLTDPDGPGVPAVAAVHAGRRGVVAGVVGATVDALRAAGAEPARAVVGPAICGACYEVSPEVHDEVVAVAPEAASRTPDGTPALDLRAAVAAQLRAAGVEQVEPVDGCTAEDPSLYSYRRDGVTGRSAVVAWLDPSADG